MNDSLGESSLILFLLSVYEGQKGILMRSKRNSDDSYGKVFVWLIWQKCCSTGRKKRKVWMKIEGNSNH